MKTKMRPLMRKKWNTMLAWAKIQKVTLEWLKTANVFENYFGRH